MGADKVTELHLLFRKVLDVLTVPFIFLPQQFWDTADADYEDGDDAFVITSFRWALARRIWLSLLEILAV